jgi:hypothetical protein
MRPLALLPVLIASTVRIAAAHIVPIPPSLCAFEPLDLRTAATGVSGTAAAAGPDDMIRIVYDASASEIQVCPADRGDPSGCGNPVPRPFTLGVTAGTITFPGLFQGGMLSSGDMTMPDVPLAITVGGSTATVPVTLTTGLVAVDGVVAEGTPLQELGSVKLVGVLGGSALPPPLTGQSILLTLSCLPRPVPDKDQFPPPLEMASIKGAITSKQVQLRVTAALASSSSRPNFVGSPVLLAVDADGTTIASAILSTGLHGRRQLTGKSDDGRAVITVRQSGTRVVLTATLHGVALPPQAPGGRVLVDVTMDVGGLIGRGEQLFQASHNGRRLRPS